MKKNLLFPVIFAFALSSCTYLTKGSGQVVYHWEKDNTGVEKFSRDHAECLIEAKEFSFIPDFRMWFYTEETKLNTRFDGKSDKGIWASYIPYAGAQPILVNSRTKDEDINPPKYRKCMESKGYWRREHDIPEITNINLHKEKQRLPYRPFGAPLISGD